MPIFRVTGTATISVSAEVEADDEASAMEAARDLVMPGLCHQCADAGDDGEWSLSGELDGEGVPQRAELVRQ